MILVCVFIYGYRHSGQIMAHEEMATSSSFQDVSLQTTDASLMSVLEEGSGSSPVGFNIQGPQISVQDFGAVFL